MCLLWDNSSFGVCTRSHTPQNGPFSHVLGCNIPFTSSQCGEHIPSAPKSGPGIHPMHIKLRLCHLIGTLYMLGWVRMPESGVVQVASTTGHDLVFPRYFAHQKTHFKSIYFPLFGCICTCPRVRIPGTFTSKNFAHGYKAHKTQNHAYMYREGRSTTVEWTPV
jgi:hypothetical protein